MPVLVVSSLVFRAHPVSREGVDGWLPALAADVREGSGPLSVIVAGSAYEIPTAGSGEGVTTRELLPEGPVLTASGELPFELRMRGELLFSGTVVVSASGGKWRAAPPMPPPAHVVVEVSGDEDAPWLAATLWLPGGVGENDVVAALEREGEPVGVDLEVDSAVVIGDSTRVRVGSPALRAWLLADYSDADEWHELFENPGDYRLTANDETVEFAVVDGVIRTAGPAELDLLGDLVLYADDGPVWGGAIAHPVDVTAWYERFIDFGGGDAADEVDRSPEASAVIEAVDTNVGTYFDDLSAGGGSLDHDQVDYALGDFRALRERVTAVLASEGDDAELAAASARLDELIALASRFLGLEAADAAARLAPFRAVLHGDKLAVCLDRPPHEYRYLTIGKRELTTPDELAAAPVWYFEGGGAEGGLLLEVSSWSVLGFRFAPDHTLLDRTETAGLGPSAPTSAFP